MTDVEVTVATVETVDVESLRLAERLREQTRENYAFHNAVMKSVTVANAAYTLALLLASSVSPWLWLPFWIASAEIVTVNFMGMSMGSRMIVFDPDWRDSAYPLAQTMAEFLLFSVLAPVGGSLPMLHYWFAVLAVHATITVLVFSAILERANRAELAPMMRSFVEFYLRMMRLRRKILVVNGFAWLGVFILLSFYALARWPELAPWQALLGVVAMCAGFIGIASENRSQRELVEFVRSTLRRVQVAARATGVAAQE